MTKIIISLSILIFSAFIINAKENPGASADETTSPAGKPNVAFIFADDLGWGDLACYGHPYAIAPALDELAREGIRFQRFYVTGVICCPSRTGIMTSRHPASYPKYMAQHGFAGKITITEILNNNGYTTC